MNNWYFYLAVALMFWSAMALNQYMNRALDLWGSREPLGVKDANLTLCFYLGLSWASIAVSSVFFQEAASDDFFQVGPPAARRSRVPNGR